MGRGAARTPVAAGACEQITNRTKRKRGVWFVSSHFNLFLTTVTVLHLFPRQAAFAGNPRVVISPHRTPPQCKMELGCQAPLLDMCLLARTDALVVSTDQCPHSPGPSQGTCELESPSCQRSGEWGVHGVTHGGVRGRAGVWEQHIQLVGGLPRSGLRRGDRPAAASESIRAVRPVRLRVAT